MESIHQDNIIVGEVLMALNKLNQKSQFDLLDESAIGSTLDLSISFLEETFFMGSWN